MERDDDSMVVVGRVAAVFGLRGAIRIQSMTDPKENLGRYRPWFLRGERSDWREVNASAIRAHGKALVASIAGVEDRNAASALVGCDIGVRRSQLPPTGSDEYYWVDLVGLTVRNSEGIELGTVESLLETGANDVLVVRGDRERLIPMLQGSVVIAVDLEGGVMEVDWDPEF